MVRYFFLFALSIFLAFKVNGQVCTSCNVEIQYSEIGGSSLTVDTHGERYEERWSITIDPQTTCNGSPTQCDFIQNFKIDNREFVVYHFDQGTWVRDFGVSVSINTTNGDNPGTSVILENELGQIRTHYNVSNLQPNTIYRVFFRLMDQHSTPLADLCNDLPNSGNDWIYHCRLYSQFRSPFVTINTVPTSWLAGTSGTIRWSDNVNGDNVTLELFKNGSFVNQITKLTSGESDLFTYTLPNSTLSGADYQVKITHDRSGFSEFSEMFEVIAASNNEDIFITNETASKTSGIRPGESITVSCRQNYSGNRTFDELPGIDMGYYLSIDDIFDPGSDIQLATDVSRIGSDNTDDFESATITLPANVSRDNYHLLFVPDIDNEIDEGVNENDLGDIPITIDLPVEDLYLSNISIAPQPTPEESTFTINYTANYSGDRPYGGFPNPTVRIYFSENDQLDGGDTYIIDETIVTLGSNIPTDNVSETKTLHHSVDPGNHYLIFVMDYYDVLEEGTAGENNNVIPYEFIVEPGQADLIVVDLEDPGDLEMGSTVTLRATVRNNGTISAISTVGRFILSIDDHIGDGNDTPIGSSFFVPALSAGEEVEVTYDYTVPDNAGLFYLSLQCDREGNVEEGDIGEDNNYFIPPLEVQIVDPCTFTNPSSSDGELYDAFCYLCAAEIINCVEDGRPNDLLIRQDLAKVGYRSIFNEYKDTFNDFKSIWFDLRNSDDTLHNYAVALSYLDYGDGISPFTRENFLFNPADFIKRQDLLKFYLELFNIAPDENLGETANDMHLVDPFNVGYVKKALALGIVETDENGNIRPNERATRGGAFVMIYRILTNNSIAKPTVAELDNRQSYFLPLNYQFGNLAQSKGATEGVFKNYAVGAFNIADKGFVLDFNATYHSYLEELPGKLFPYEQEGFGEVFPMGTGWTHNYFHYLLQIDGVTLGNGKENNHLVWVQPEGEMVVFENDGANYPIQTFGYFGQLTQSGGDYIYSDKYQTKYHFSHFTDPRLNGDKVYHLVAIVDRNGNTLTISYDATGFGRTKEVIAPSGRKLVFEYENDKLKRVIDNNLSPAREVIFTYQNGQVSSFTDAVGNVTQFNYVNDPSPYKNGKLAIVTLPRGNTITTDYNYWGRVETIDNSSGVKWENLYQDPINLGLSTTTITTLGIDTEEIVTKYSPLGLLQSVKGISGSPIDNRYIRNHSDSTLVTSLIQYGSLNWNIGYDLKGNLETYDYEGLSASIRYHPTFNLPITYTDFEGNVTVVTRNGSNGNAESILAPGNNNETVLTYFDWGAPETVTNPEGITTTYEYNEYGNPTTITSPEGIEITKTFDGASRLKTSSLDGRNSGFNFDSNDNLTEFTDARGKITRRTYDANQNLSTVTNALGKPTTFTYFDEEDWLKTISFGGFTRQFDYYENGLLKEVIKPSGQRLTYDYDTQNRFFSDGEISEVVYNPDQTIQSITNSYGKLTLGYDQYQRLNSSDWEGNEVTYSKDNNGNVTQIKFGNDYEVNKTYDGQNRLYQVKWFNQILVTYDYLEDGRIRKETLGNGVETSYTYDGAGREKTRRTTKLDGTVILGYTYDWSAAGNIESIAMEHDENTGDLYATIDKNYTINVNTNRISNFSNGEQSLDFTFDADGNTTGKGDVTFTWDIKDRLSTQSGGSRNHTYTYDPNNLRQTATRNGVTTTYIWDIHGLGEVIAILEEGGEQSFYIHGLGAVAKVENGHIAYYHSDFSGNINALTNESANISHRYIYDPFGNLLSSQESDFNPLRFSGKYGILWEENGLYYVRARYYDSEIGRFLSEDPIWSTNLYPYAGNNPITQIDPSGEEPALATLGLILTGISLSEGIYHMYSAQWYDYKSMMSTNQELIEKYQRKKMEHVEKIWEPALLAGFGTAVKAPGIIIKITPLIKRYLPYLKSTYLTTSVGKKSIKAYEFIEERIDNLKSDINSFSRTAESEFEYYIEQKYNHKIWK